MKTTQPLENRIGVGSRVYHMTCNDSFEFIRQTDLWPRTHASFGMSNHLNISLTTSYVVCGATRDFSDWKEYGLFNDLIKHICKNSLVRKPKIITLSFELEQAEGVLVADHAHLSSKRFIEVYGEDLLSIHKKCKKLNRNQWKVWQAQNEKYDHSAVLLPNYKGGYELPEIWIPEVIPFDKITVEEVLK